MHPIPHILRLLVEVVDGWEKFPNQLLEILICSHGRWKLAEGFVYPMYKCAWAGSCNALPLEGAKEGCTVAHTSPMGNPRGDSPRGIPYGDSPWGFPMGNPPWR